MTTLLRGLGGLLMSVCLFMGFNVVNFFSADGADRYIGATTATFFRMNKLWLYLIVGGLFVAQQIWVWRRRPASTAEVDEVGRVIQPLFPSIVQEYYQTTTAFRPGGAAAPTVRLNIMLPTWRRFRCGQYLKMYYVHGGPANVMHSNEEQDLPWARGQGTCGFAWKVGRAVVYDSVNPAFTSPEKRLTRRQREVVGPSVKSVLCVPMKYPKSAKVVGVLSLDSGFNVDRTFFNRVEVSRKLDAWGRMFGRMLFEDGVAPR